jgi:hypothetical protein
VFRRLFFNVRNGHFTCVKLPDPDASIFRHFHLEKSATPAAKAWRQKPVVCPAFFDACRQGVRIR